MRPEPAEHSEIEAGEHLVMYDVLGDHTETPEPEDAHQEADGQVEPEVFAPGKAGGEEALQETSGVRSNSQPTTGQGPVGGSAGSVTRTPPSTGPVASARFSGSAMR